MVNWHTVCRILGVMLAFFSLASIPPLIIADIYREPENTIFAITMAVNICCGIMLWLPFKGARQPLQPRDGFVITVFFWVILGSFGSLPLLLMDKPALSFTDAIFESFSGLTTTGATILTHIDALPRSILYYRQQLQWLGGMGLVVLAVAVLPSLGVGSIQLYRTEIPGPVKDSKLTPRIAETAKSLWKIYLGLTVVCAVCYYLAGMNWFDAICHSFSTVAIGGFSTHDESIGYFNSPVIDDIAIIFMLISGINFTLHYVSWHRKSWKHYFKDPEFTGYIRFIATGSFCTIVVLAFTNTYSGLKAFEYGAFEFISTATTTGFAIIGFSSWPVFLTQFLLFASFIGCCSGSAGGGIKVMRVLLIVKQGYQELKQLVHPSGIFTLRLGDIPVPTRTGSAVWAFLAMYILLFFFLYLGLLVTGVDTVTAFSTLASCMNNLGPALGWASVNYAQIPEAAKWILIFAMLLGRLELFTLLVLFTPVFWKR